MNERLTRPLKVDQVVTVYELKKNELGPGLANDWTGRGGPGPGPEKMPRTWPGPDFGQSIVNSRSFKSPKSDEPRRVQVLDLYCLY